MTIQFIYREKTTAWQRIVDGLLALPLTICVCCLAPCVWMYRKATECKRQARPLDILVDGTIQPHRQISTEAILRAWESNHRGPKQ